jgi:methionine-rich copper-binding protein CopC
MLWTLLSQHIPPHIPQQKAFVLSHKPQQRANNQTAIRKRPGNDPKPISSNQQLAKYPTTYSTTYTTANSICRSTKATVNSKQPERNPKTTRTQPESNEQLAKYPITYSTNYSTTYSTKYPTAKIIQRSTTATANRNRPERKQKTTSKQPESNQQQLAKYYPTLYSTTNTRTYSTTDPTALSIRRGTTATANTKQPQSYQQANRGQP